jgi:2-C-methyl-D-erythritol 4-phosphate cytidylyltransferase
MPCLELAEAAGPDRRAVQVGYHAPVAEQAGTTHAGIVLAAGSGTRVGSSRNKVYLPLAGRRIVTWSLELLRRTPGIARLVLVVRDRDRELAEEVLDRELPGVPVDLVTGGATRHESEYRALLHLADEIRRGEIDVVLVHDAARPLAPVRIVEEVLATASRTGGAIPALSLEEVVGVDETGRMSHPGRSDMVRVQTPQAFRSGLLLAAYQAAAVDGFAGPDTASCVERYEGVPVQVVPGDPRNIKVTYADDLFAAELFLAASGYEL